MKLYISTLEDTLFEGEVSTISLPGTKGRFQVLEKHASLLSTLEKGTVYCTGKTPSSKQGFAIEDGVVEVHKNKVVVLTSAGKKISD